METRGKVSEAVVRRLPGYYRYLENLENSGMTRISSQELSVRMGLTASQIRQDINCFGTLGQQGYGYNIAELRQRIGEIMGLTHIYNVAIVGAGNIGQAVAQYQGFAKLGFWVKVLFDIDPNVCPPKDSTVKVLPLFQLPIYLSSNKIDIGVITTPAHVAQSTADALMQGGIRALWNFAPIDLAVLPGCVIQNVALTDSLLILAYHMQNDAKIAP